MARGIIHGDPAKFYVGQELVLTGVNMRGRTEPVRVTKVGRLNVFVDWHGREKPFRMADGGEVGDFSHYAVYTPEGWADKQQRDQLFEDLRKLGISIAGYRQRQLSTDQLVAIVATVKVGGES